MKWYKNIWFWFTIVLIIVFIIVPIACGYSIGILKGFQMTLESIYYVLSIAGAIATCVAVGVTILIAKKQEILIKEQTKISEKQADTAKNQLIL